MSPIQGSSQGSTSSLAEVFDFSTGQLIQEFGYDDDVDMDLRDAIEDAVDEDLEDEDSQEIVDAVIVWWREGDGDLVDTLVDSLATLVAGGPVWVLTPKAGRPGHVDPVDIQDAAKVAGLRYMKAVSLAGGWGATRLASRA